MSIFKRGLSKIKQLPGDKGGDQANGSVTGPAPAKKRFPSPIARLRDTLSPSNSSSEEALANDNSINGISKNQRKKEEKQKVKEEKKSANAERHEKEQRRREEEHEHAAKEEPKEMRRRYGTFPIGQSRESDRDSEKRLDLGSHSSKLDTGDEVTFRARVSTIRRMGAKLAFIVFRQQELTIQGVLTEEDGVVSSHFLRWAEHIPVESVVLVKGTVKEPDEELSGPSVHNAEVAIQELHIVSQPTESLPFNVYDADIVHGGDDEKNEARMQHLHDRTRLANRIIDLRTAPSQAIFRVNAGITKVFRNYLDSLGFIEIHTPKLQGGATESGSSVFKVDYFGRPAFLAQSPQLAKQMCISADMEKVYEVGPVFRAENSNTHRHLTEYTGLDLEMTIERHYHEALDVIDEMLKHVWKGIYDQFRQQIEVIKCRYPHEDLAWLDKTPRIPFKDAIRMMRESGWTDDEGNPPSEYEDLSTRQEIALGKLVKEKYHTDYYILDKFPASARPFYTMPDPEDPKITNSFDIFLRGQEILSGGQRIHDAKMLEEQMTKMGMQLGDGGLDDYLDGFRWGAPLHAGGGIGLERVLMLLLGLGNIRLASLFPRDPKSLPEKTSSRQLRYPEFSTTKPLETKGDREARDLQPLVKLIANYGDATNTSYLEDRTKVWRHDESGAAIGYVPSDGFAIVLGNPLCESYQYGKVITSFLRWLHVETDLKPLWLLAGGEVEEVLGAKFNWKSLSCIAEQRTDLDKNDAGKNKDLQRKLRHAEHEGVKITDLPPNQPVPEDIRHKCGKRIDDWLANRKGQQVHLTAMKEETVFQDMEHRRYFYATDKEDKICALVVMAELAIEHGYQMKYLLDFPGAPNGTIEYITLHAMQAAQDAGTKSVTFGAGATDELTSQSEKDGLRVKALKRAYAATVRSLKLTQKSDFREKLGADMDPIFICYPKRTLSPRAIKAIMDIFEADE